MKSPRQDSIHFQAPILPSKVGVFEFQNLRVRDTEFSAIIERGKATCHIEITKRSGSMPILVVK